MLQSITQDEILNRLRTDNVWWSTGKVSSFYENLPKRDFLELFFPYIKDIVLRRAAVLLGNTVGKTVLIHQSIGQLILKGISPHKIGYISFKNRYLKSFSLGELFDFCQSATGQVEKAGWYMFYDHLEYKENWALELEKLVDQFPSVKFVAISNTHYMLPEKEIGKGRFNVLTINPLTFYEYIRMNALEHLLIPAETEWEGNSTNHFQSSNIGLLNEHFIQYCNKGASFEFVHQNQNGELLSTLKKDLFYYNGLKNPEEITKLVEIIALNSGKEFSFEMLSQMMDGIEKNTLKKYLKYLEQTFLITIIERRDTAMRPYQRASFFVIHFNNMALRSHIFHKTHATDMVMNHLVKSVLQSQMLYGHQEKMYYAGWIQGRHNLMVDMVGTHYRNPEKKWVIQIQWNNHYYDNFFDLKSVFQFCEENKMENVLITTIDKSGKKISNKVKYHFIPTSVLAYTLSYNAIVNKIQLYL